MHRSELNKGKGFALMSNPLLLVEDGARTHLPDDEGNQY
jgi:hypothetical protein